MSGTEQNVIHWGENVFVVDGDNDLAVVVEGQDRYEWLNHRAETFASYVLGRRMNELSDQQAETMRAALVDTLQAGGGFDDKAQIEQWLDKMITGDENRVELLDIGMHSDLFDGTECWRLFDEPVGEVYSYAECLSDAHNANMARLAILQPSLLDQ